ncbi:hypothetical protein ACOSQ2_028614 [Xanthoceras sorbifolium]
MRRRGRPPTRRAAARALAPSEEHVDEYVNVPTHSPPPQPAVPEGGPGDAVQLAQMLAAAFNQPREPNVSIECARKLGTKPYDSTGDPERALSWLESNEEIFQVMGYTEEHMVTYSAFLLKDRAKDWWKALQRRHPEGKFYPKSYRNARVEEFFRLEQGSMSVAYYERRFSELIRVVPYIANNEEEKANRFAVGLM